MEEAEWELELASQAGTEFLIGRSASHVTGLEWANEGGQTHPSWPLETGWESDLALEVDGDEGQIHRFWPLETG